MSALTDILHDIVTLAHDARQIDHSQFVKDLRRRIDEHAEAEADAAAAVPTEPGEPGEPGESDEATAPASSTVFSDAPAVQHG